MQIQTTETESGEPEVCDQQIEKKEKKYFSIWNYKLRAQCTQYHHRRQTNVPMQIDADVEAHCVA